MSKKAAESIGLKIGEKVLFPRACAPFNVQMSIVTIKDVRPLYGDEDDGSRLVIDLEEFDGYLDSTDVYSLDQIKRMFDQE